ncbi:MAG: PEP-CTERM-box response regulator transcription factor [Gammaproteobacteria bacterium]|nr:PEP-CTERM-box response regulator transcription factor [Gammaproteobacteria bacterium]MBI5618425.1 PEP-CTERM-box response regulator transcription factor [Gammaproteobacteria bacterium]
MIKRKMLVVDDDPGLQRQLKWSLEDYEVVLAGDREQALEELKRHEPAVVTLDLGLPPDPANASEGLKALTEIVRIAPATKVIVITGNDERENAVKAVAQGAYDFYEKPIDPDVLRLIVERAHRLYDLEAENRRLTQIGREPLAGVIAASTQMLDVCRRLEKIAPTSASVLLLGESGTGKEVLARAIHEISPRREKRFVAINCAAIPETLLESELFGYEKGAFTGAVKQTKGKLEGADSGTLFLDEMGDLPTPLQAKLLRFLQERVIERIGGREEIPVDTRVVCATHKNLKNLIGQGAFREDLYYRISEVSISIPPLRDRAGDAILIARALLAKFRDMNSGAVKDFSHAALAAIEQYEWPGNVRELENRVKRAVIMAEGSLIEAHDLELDPPATSGFRTLKAVREEAEANAILQALAVNDGQIGKAAEMLGVSRPTVYHLLKKYNIQA